MNPDTCLRCGVEAPAELMVPGAPECLECAEVCLYCERPADPGLIDEPCCARCAAAMWEAA